MPVTLVLQTSAWLLQLPSSVCHSHLVSHRSFAFTVTVEHWHCLHFYERIVFTYNMVKKYSYNIWKGTCDCKKSSEITKIVECMSLYRWVFSFKEVQIIMGSPHQRVSVNWFRIADVSQSTSFDFATNVKTDTQKQWKTEVETGILTSLNFMQGWNVFHNSIFGETPIAHKTSVF